MRRIVVVFMLAALGVMAVAGTAWARPITFTEVTRPSPETFTDESTRCQTELYSTTFYGSHTVVHVTYFPDTGALHFHEMAHGKIVAVPLDGTGPSYRGNWRLSDSENIRNVKRGELVEVDTDFDRFVAHGSDGSRAFFKFHAHFTINANGVEAVRFEMERLICT